jgi:hypothetical protein
MMWLYEFGNRLLQDVRGQAPKHTKIRISSPPEQLNSHWMVDRYWQVWLRLRICVGYQNGL